MTEFPWDYQDPGGNAAFHGNDIPHLHKFAIVDVLEIELEPEDDFAPYGARIYVRMCQHCEEINEVWHEPGSLLVGEAEEAED